MIIFVGDKPSSRMRPGAKPFEGAACEKLLYDWILDIIGYNAYEGLGYRKLATIVNQCDYNEYWFGYCHKKGHKFIALGNNASKALKSVPHFKLPHPSGRNRQINDPKFIEAKLRECKKWLTNCL